MAQLTIVIGSREIVFDGTTETIAEIMEEAAATNVYAGDGVTDLSASSVIWAMMNDHELNVLQPGHRNHQRALGCVVNRVLREPLKPPLAGRIADHLPMDDVLVNVVKDLLLSYRLEVSIGRIARLA